MKIREAIEADLATIISLLTDDELGANREAGNITPAYSSAFTRIQNDPHASLLVIEAGDGSIIAYAQVNYLTYRTYQGGKRAQIENVRVHKDHRGQGIGTMLIEYIKENAKQNGCHMIQLTINRIRVRARQFYDKLGFIDSHAGMVFVNDIGLSRGNPESMSM